MEILGQASDPRTIQPHLLSIFDAVATVDFEEGTIDKIEALNSANFEKIPLDAIVKCSGGVEVWIGKLLDEMQSTVSTILSSFAVAMSEPEFNFIVDFQEYCGQGGLLGVQIYWTRDAEYALRKCRTDKLIMKRTNIAFLDLLNSFIELTVRDLSKLDRIKFETMVTIHVHQRDIFDDLVRLRVKFINDFEWQKQARFYYISDTDEVIVSITDVDFIYQNEYLGVVERLAITPLTDRCYITLAQAMGKINTLDICSILISFTFCDSNLQECHWVELLLDPLELERLKLQRTWVERWVSLWLSSIAPIKWTSVDWDESIKDLPSLGLGDALTNSIELNYLFCRWQPNKFSKYTKKKRLGACT